MLQVMLDKINDHYLEKGQPYLASLYRAMCCIAYHGMLRVSEFTSGEHNIFVKDVNSSIKTKQLELVIRSSKTQNRGDRPRIIKTPFRAENVQPISVDLLFQDQRYCPCKIIRYYGKEMRPKSKSDSEPFFIYSDGTPVRADQFRAMIKNMIKLMNVDEKLYNTQSFRIGAASDLFKRGANLDQLMVWGRWSSTAVLKYIRDM